MARSAADIEHLVHLGPEERRLLTGGVRPIVLLRRRGGEPPPGQVRVCQEVAPGSPDLGVMLAYTPFTICCWACRAMRTGRACSS